jgi:hypothetical protein
MWYYGMYQLLIPVSNARTLQHIISLLKAFLLFDLFTYLIHEAHLTGPVKGLVEGVWILVGMDSIYQVFLTVLSVFSYYTIPIKYRHYHPLLSVSSAEFWVSRWNPFTSRLLQLACHRSIKNSNSNVGNLPAIAQLSCFLGSALMHAYAVFMSSYSLLYTWNMFIYFLWQAIVLIIEHSVHSGITMIAHKLSKCSNKPRSYKEQYKTRKLASNQSYYEMVLVGSLIYIYAMMELNPITTSLILINLYNIYTMQYEIYQNHIQAIIHVIGWLGMLANILSSMHIFNTPIVYCLQGVFEKSFLIGPLINTVQILLNECAMDTVDVM